MKLEIFAFAVAICALAFTIHAAREARRDWERAARYRAEAAEIRAETEELRRQRKETR